MYRVSYFTLDARLYTFLDFYFHFFRNSDLLASVLFFFFHFTIFLTIFHFTTSRHFPLGVAVPRPRWINLLDLCYLNSSSHFQHTFNAFGLDVILLARLDATPRSESHFPSLPHTHTHTHSITRCHTHTQLHTLACTPITRSYASHHTLLHTVDAPYRA